MSNELPTAPPPPCLPCSASAARKTLPEFYALLEAGTEEGTESDDTLSMACQTANLLTLKEQDTSRPLLKNNLIHALNHLSKDMYASKPSLFLYAS